MLPATGAGAADDEDQIRQSLEEMYQELLTVREEINHLREEERDVSRPERRAKRAHQLYEEAVFELEKRHTPVARAKARAMQIIDRAGRGKSWGDRGMRPSIARVIPLPPRRFVSTR